MPHTISKRRIYRMQIRGNYDPERPSWAQTDTVLLADHPQTKVGYLARHFFSQPTNSNPDLLSLALNDTIPAWTYKTLQHYSDEGYSIFNTSNWTLTSKDNVAPPMSGPVPNTQGVYVAQKQILGKTLLDAYYISDIDVLRFWPVGRPDANGGLEAFQIASETSILINDGDPGIFDARAIIERGAADISDDTKPWVLIYKDAYLNSRQFEPKTWPSYIDRNVVTQDEHLYPLVPELGMWPHGGKEIGIVSWSWTSSSMANAYVHFTDSWYQNLSTSTAPGSSENPYFYQSEYDSYPYGAPCCPTKELTAIQTGNADGGAPTSYPASQATGMHITTETGIAHGYGEWWPGPCHEESLYLTPRKLLLADQIWGGTYYVGGFNIENRGLAYHLGNAVKWDSLSTDSSSTRPQPFIGDLKDPLLFAGGYGSSLDGNYGPIPPYMSFEGGGEASWNSSLKNTAPYSSYSDYDAEYAALDDYYSNTEEYLICSFVDYPNRDWVKVHKPSALRITDKHNQRVCPEYNINDIIIAQEQEDGLANTFIDLNSNARKLIDYTNKGTLYAYWDYFPEPYIPFETSFLIPETQTIPSYSFNCTEHTYSNTIATNSDGSSGDKGEKGGGSASKGHKGEKGAKGNRGDKGANGQGGDLGMIGDPGEKGFKGELGPKGNKGPKGGRGSGGDEGIKGGKGELGEKGVKGFLGPPGDTPAGDKGVGIITGTSFGIINSEQANYTTSSVGTFDITLGDASTTSNESTTIQFTRKHFGVCAENSSDEPEYKGIHVYASDFIT